MVSLTPCKLGALVTRRHYTSQYSYLVALVSYVSWFWFGIFLHVFLFFFIIRFLLDGHLFYYVASCMQICFDKSVLRFKYCTSVVKLNALFIKCYSIMLPCRFEMNTFCRFLTSTLKQLISLFAFELRYEVQFLFLILKCSVSQFALPWLCSFA